MHGRNTLCHYTNPLHVYCRLRDLGMGRKTALRAARRYEAALTGLKGWMTGIGARRARRVRISGGIKP